MGETAAGNFTIGIEEEYQIIDPKTREMKNAVSFFLEEGARLLGEQIKPELHQSMIEVGTNICANIEEAKDEILRLRGTISYIAKEHGLGIAASGSHPFSDWSKQSITEKERYNEIIEEMQDIARSILIFGLHVHIGIEDRETAVQLMNSVRYFLPHLLAFSANSPFWQGRDTGLKSIRHVMFRRMPRTGIPDYFGSYVEFQRFTNLLMKTHSIDNGRKIWWDIRPHPIFSTLEFRVCDLPTRWEETLMIAALAQALIYKLYRLHQRNQSWRIYRSSLIEENVWRAIRYGLDGKLIDFGKECEVPERELAMEVLAFVDDVVDELGSRPYVSYLKRVLEEGNGADRQLKVYREKKDLKAVVDYLMEETIKGVPEVAAQKK